MRYTINATGNCNFCTQISKKAMPAIKIFFSEQDSLCAHCIQSDTKENDIFKTYTILITSFRSFLYQEKSCSATSSTAGFGHVRYKRYKLPAQLHINCYYAYFHWSNCLCQKRIFITEKLRKTPTQ